MAKTLGTTTDDLLEQEDEFDGENDIKIIKTLIARNAEALTGINYTNFWMVIPDEI